LPPDLLFLRRDDLPDLVPLLLFLLLLPVPLLPNLGENLTGDAAVRGEPSR
jgi:hypothetical protein